MIFWVCEVTRGRVGDGNVSRHCLQHPPSVLGNSNNAVTYNNVAFSGGLFEFVGFPTTLSLWYRKLQ